ncbi:MAG: ABC transporter substrate-binding protein [Candidatus Limivivens sp.]|nr:ABC transporter substrate-binding protein [Candidatus Limivivens sp.]
MKKKVLATMMAGAMATGMAMGVSAEDVDKLVVSLRITGTTPAEVAVVQEAISEITREKIGAEVELLIIPSGSYAQQMTLMLSGDEKLDVMGANLGVYNTAMASEALKPLDDLLAEHGTGIIEKAGEAHLEQGKVNGVQYGIPVMCDSAVGYGTFMMRTDLLEKYDIDVSEVDSYEDVSEIFAIIHENEPDMTVVAPASPGYSNMQYCVEWDKLSNYFGVLEDHGQTTTVTNLFEAEDYINYLNVMHGWYESGYISKDVTTSTEAGASMMAAGNLFCYISANKPGIEAQEENASGGVDLTAVQVLETMKTTATNWQWTIPENCEYPEKAMEFINLLFTDEDIVNLMCYGIEGEHYVVKDDGTITWPEGKDASTVGYNMSANAWAVGNEFLSKVWETNDPDIWEQTQAWNETGVVSKAYGFFYDNSAVTTEITAVQSVYDEYRLALESGVLDPETTLAEMNEKMYAAGLQTIIDDKQSQLDAWLAERE